MGSTVNAKNGDSTVKLILTAAPNVSNVNVLRVRLSGPNSINRDAFIAPGVFELKSGSTLIYTFDISKWFIVRPVITTVPSGAVSYCNTLGNGYRVPSVGEMTNANSTTWTGTLPGWANNTYARAIGDGLTSPNTPPQIGDGTGGLFSEWGFINSNYYSLSEFPATSKYFWSPEPKNNGYLMVTSSNGSAGVGASNGYDICTAP